MNLIENIRNYFEAKSKDKETGKAPEGICPNCWGKQEWEGKFYKRIKGMDTLQNPDIYKSFINDVVEKLDKIILEKDTYICETCKMKQ